MELFSVSKQKYEEIVKDNKYAYNETWFHEINREKVDELYYLLFKSKKYKFYIIAGVADGVMKFPYSAPFSILENNKDVSIEDIEHALALLESFALQINIKEITFRLPPDIYDNPYISKFQNCLIRSKYMIECWDLNYYFDINDMDGLDSRLQRNARKNLRIAQTYNYELICCESLQQKKMAYDIIAVNRKNRGYPLRMSWSQVCNTIEYMKHDFFLLTLDKKPIASAIIFRVNKDIYQVIYWGDIGEHLECKPMNYLAYALYEYYMNKKIRILDIGPSTEGGTPNYGLCSFKESIGCTVCSKISFRKYL